MHRLNIAMFVAKYDPTHKNPWLTDELCEAFDNQGHTIDVFFLDWNEEFTATPIVSRGNTRVHVIAPFGNKSGPISKSLRWAFSSFNIYRYYCSQFEKGYHDVLISFSPSVLFGIALLKLRSSFRHRILIQWDFFPYHQEQIGLIPFRWITRIGAILESKLLSTFTFIGCMSPRNVQYLTRRYRLAPNVQTGIVPLWAKIRDKPKIDKTQLRKDFGLPLSTPIVIFGGQLTAGRGIEEVVEASYLAAENNAPLHFLIVGKGPKLEWVREHSLRNSDKLTVLPHVDRDRYIELLACCDAGIVATVRDVDVPTFPSKTLDYCCAGLPIIASVEQSTDYAEIVSATGIGLACEAGDGAELLALCLKLFYDDAAWRLHSQKSRNYYEQNFNVRKIASDLILRIQDAELYAK